MKSVFESSADHPALSPRTVDDAAIRMENVSVRYRLPNERMASLKEYAIRRLEGRVIFRDFWALRGIDLIVPRGEVVAVIGRNGAGKTTLLKVIARVLRPTTGRVYVRGRIVPLVDVGAGFHPELTGRENVFLNATLLGRSRRDTEAGLNEIVDFAELEDFIDAPLRTYSAGMTARLGFAVATTWEPDILLIDEVLAVGDEPFQRKSRARLESFRSNGVTVLIVSHNAALVQALCSRAFWLDHGVVRAAGDPIEVLRLYRSAAEAGEFPLRSPASSPR